jgi:hypothetical protein
MAGRTLKPQSRKPAASQFTSYLVCWGRKGGGFWKNSKPAALQKPRMVCAPQTRPIMSANYASDQSARRTILCLA